MASVTTQDEPFIIIMFHGEPGAGKDSSGDVLAKKYGFTKISFATPLKDYVAKEFSIERWWFDDTVKKNTPLKEFPVNIDDEYSKMVDSYIVTHFRTSEGKKARNIQDVTISPEGFLHLDTSIRRSTDNTLLYHTPRSLCILEGCNKRAIDPAHWGKKSFANHDMNIKRVVVPDFRFKAEFRYLSAKFEKLGGRVITGLVYNGLESDHKDASQSSLKDFAFDYYLPNNREGLEFLEQEVDTFAGNYNINKR